MITKAKHSLDILILKTTLALIYCTDKRSVNCLFIALKFAVYCGMKGSKRLRIVFVLYVDLLSWYCTSQIFVD